MATRGELLKIKVELDNQATGVLDRANKSSNVLPDDSRAKKELNQTIKSIEGFQKETNLTITDVRRYRQKLQSANDIIMRLEEATGKVTENAKKLEEKVWQKSKGLNKDKTNFSYAEIGRQARAAGIKNRKGEEIQSDSYVTQLYKEWLQDNKKVAGYTTRDGGDLSTLFNKITQKGSEQAAEYKAAATELQNLSVNADSSKIWLDASNSNIDLEGIERQLNGVSRGGSADDFVQGPTDSKINSEASNAIDKQTSSLGKAFKQFTLYAIAIRSAKKALNEAKKTIIDLDKYLTEQAMVTGKTRRQTYALLSSYQDLARQLGSTTKEVSEVATQYMRQGKSTEDALKLTEAAISAAKVAGISAIESVTYLTTALNGFQLSANDAMKVSDKFASIAAQSASSYEELAIALSKVASQANLAGMSIDYTTALLAKGLETTREAPETIGTALKTVIARMREMGDYGETLEGDTDVNNVETQLAYVGIALKNANGELRSTEEVLDELGRKWNELSVNQQAAIAKALAGTRQQSRLIAMMQDYERVIELQEISQRSAGATAAQMDTYLQGMDAALNKLNNAWERIVTNVTNSDVIIGFIETITWALDHLADFLNSTAGMVITLTTISAIGLTILGQKMNEMMIAKQQQAYNISQQKAELERNKMIAKAVKTTQKLSTQKLRELAIEKGQTYQEALQVLYAAKQKKLAGEITDQELQQAQIDADQARKEWDRAEADAARAEAADVTLNTYEQQNQLLNGQASLLGNLGNMMGLITGPLFTVVALYKTIIGLIGVMRAKKSADHAKTMGELTAENSLNATSAAGKIISQLGVPGIVIAAAILAALVGAGFAIAASVKEQQENSVEGVNKSIKGLNAEIYNLEKTSSTLKTVESKFDAIDNKIIKTKEDMKELSELMSSAADTMSTESANNTSQKEMRRARRHVRWGTATQAEKELVDSQNLFGGDSEQEWFNRQSRQVQRNYLAEKQEKIEKELAAKREQQLNYIKTQVNRAENKTEMAEKYRAELSALVNSKLYEQIDETKELLRTQGLLTEEKEAELKAAEELSQNLTDQLSAEKQLEYLNNPEKIKAITDKALESKVKATLNGETTSTSVATVLSSDDYSILDKIEAYKTLYAELEDSEKAALKELYPAFEGLMTIIDSSSGKVVDYIEKLGISNDQINNLKKNITNIEGANQNTYLGVLDSLSRYTDIETGIVDIQSVIHENFGDLTNDSEKYKEVLKALEATIGESILNIGQNVTKTQNQINSVYEAAQKWNTMTAAEQADFLSQNAELFKGNEDLYRAFQTGDLATIEQALKGSETLQAEVQNKIRTINEQLAIEEARLKDDRNEFLIQYLKDQRDALENQNEFYKASIDMRLDLEKRQLDIYKEYLQKQQDAQVNALEKRKEAYQEYFEAINQEEEDEEYEDKANLLINNLSKLSTSDNAASKQQTKELEQQLQELESERLKELRQRAQEAVVEDLDEQVEAINEKFDKLLENNQMLLAAMLNDKGDKENFVADMVSSNVDGMTANEAQKWLMEDFQTTFGSLLSKDELAEIQKIVTTEITNLNLAGDNVQLSSDQQKTLRAAIMAALQQIGYS